MRNKWLILDCNYLAWRAFHVMGELSYGGTQTGAVYGFLRDVRNLMELFGTDKAVFCWDHGEPFRKTIYPQYKANRNHRKPAKSAEAERARKGFYSQIGKLRREYLSLIGFRNVFYAKGYEADDLIATTCQTITEQGDIGIIVSGDHDFYQLLSHSIRVYHPRPKKIVTLKSFGDAWGGLDPSDWVSIKALAGCVGDNIKGIPGIKEITAAKFLRGELMPGSHSHDLCAKMPRWQYKMNKLLVRLPWEGTPEFMLMPDRVTQERWNHMAEKLGMHSLKEWR